MAATARDVAHAAGVSVATVSRALATPSKVAARTRTRVLRAAEQLGYRPHRVARQLSTGRTYAIGLVVPDLENPFFASVTKGVQHRARAAGLVALVADTDEDVDREAENIETLASQTDGLILASSRLPPDRLAALAERLPTVLVNRQAPGLPSVVVDDRDGMRQAAVHLHALGHRRVAYAGGPAASWSDAQRRAGLSEVVPTLDGLDVVDLGTFRPGYGGGVVAADLVVASGASAVIAYNDLLALGLLARLRERGLAVPGRISVTGFDDVLLAGLVAPSLTSVSLAPARLGGVAVQILTDLTGQPATRPQSSTLPVELVVRGSTGEAPRSPVEKETR